jgi:hypothetical protein
VAIDHHAQTLTPTGNACESWLAGAAQWVAHGWLASRDGS